MSKSSNNKTLTLKGVENGVVINVDQNNSVALTSFSGSNVTFENLTIKTSEGIYKGFARMVGTYNNCKFENLYFTFHGEHKFNDCSFNANNEEHCVWTYGADDVEFNNCAFNYANRCINVYTEMGVADGVLTCNNCSFTATNADSKGAIEINSSSFANSVKVNLSNCVEPAYGEMAFISGWDSANGAKATVTIDGTIVTVPQLSK